MDSLEITIEKKIVQSKIWFRHIENDINNARIMASNFESLEILKAAKAMSDKNYTKARQHFFSASLLDKLRVQYFNNTMFDYKISSILSPLLSDNEKLIDGFTNLSYKAYGQRLDMYYYVNQGESPIWINTIQNLIANNLEKAEKNINIIENITLPKLPKNQLELKIDYTFFKALLEKNKGKCEEQIDLLVSDKIHKSRNVNNLLNNYLSQPALGYAKLAWKLGVKVDIKSQFVPIEMLSTEPLDNYQIQYEFINDIKHLSTRK